MQQLQYKLHHKKFTNCDLKCTTVICKYPVVNSIRDQNLDLHFFSDILLVLYFKRNFSNVDISGVGLSCK